MGWRRTNFRPKTREKFAEIELSNDNRFFPIHIDGVSRTLCGRINHDFLHSIISTRNIHRSIRHIWLYILKKKSFAFKTTSILPSSCKNCLLNTNSFPSVWINLKKKKIVQSDFGSNVYWFACSTTMIFLQWQSTITIIM